MPFMRRETPSLMWYEPPDDEPEEDGDEAAMDAADAKYETWRDEQLERRAEREREVTSAE